MTSSSSSSSSSSSPSSLCASPACRSGSAVHSSAREVARGTRRRSAQPVARQTTRSRLKDDAPRDKRRLCVFVVCFLCICCVFVVYLLCVVNREHMCVCCVLSIENICVRGRCAPEPESRQHNTRDSSAKCVTVTASVLYYNVWHASLINPPLSQTRHNKTHLFTTILPHTISNRATDLRAASTTPFVRLHRRTAWRRALPQPAQPARCDRVDIYVCIRDCRCTSDNTAAQLIAVSVSCYVWFKRLQVHERLHRRTTWGRAPPQLVQPARCKGIAGYEEVLRIRDCSI
jgi:hypothetical protein